MSALIGLLACAAPSYAPGPEVYDEPVAHDGDEWLFSLERISRIDLEVDPDADAILASEQLLTEPHAWVPAIATLDGEVAGEVGLRLRGGSGSFQRWGRKPKLKIDFNRYQDGFRFHGLEALSLNNSAPDCSYVAEALAGLAYAEAGVPRSRTGYAQVFVNGEDHGLYVVVETQDDRFLERVFDENDGNLYDGTYQWARWLPYFVDFGGGRDHVFDLEEGEDVGFADIAVVSDGVRATLADGRLDRSLAAAVDWELFHRLVAVERWIGNEDGYVVNGNNYRVYFPESGGPMAMIAWDLDYTFREHRDEPWQHPGRLVRACEADEGCAGEQARVGGMVTDFLEGLDWTARFDRVVDLTRQGVDEDPRGRCTSDEIEERRDALAQSLE